MPYGTPATTSIVAGASVTNGSSTTATTLANANRDRLADFFLTFTPGASLSAGNSGWELYITPSYDGSTFAQPQLVGVFECPSGTGPFVVALRGRVMPPVNAQFYATNQTGQNATAVTLRAVVYDA